MSEKTSVQAPLVLYQEEEKCVPGGARSVLFEGPTLLELCSQDQHSGLFECMEVAPPHDGQTNHQKRTVVIAQRSCFQLGRCTSTWVFGQGTLAVFPKSSTKQ